MPSGVEQTNIEASIAEVCNMAKVLPAGQEKNDALEACAYLKVLYGLARIGKCDLRGSTKAATLPDYLILNQAASIQSGCWTPGPIGGGERLLLPNWLLLDDDFLTGTAAGASCYDRFMRYNVLVHEVYRARHQKFEFEIGAKPSKAYLTAQINILDRDIDRIDDAIGRGGMPASGADPACTFTPAEVQKLQSLRDRFDKRIHGNPNAQTPVKGLCQIFAEEYPNCPLPAGCQ